MTNETSGEVITLGAGCFWCVEAVLEQIEGVLGVRSGYIGGETENPTYQDICTGTTGHAEVTEVHFDPAVLGAFKEVEGLFEEHYGSSEIAVRR